MTVLIGWKCRIGKHAARFGILNPAAGRQPAKADPSGFRIGAPDRNDFVKFVDAGATADGVNFAMFAC